MFSINKLIPAFQVTSTSSPGFVALSYKKTHKKYNISLYK